jgi:hypothetical protein
MTFQSAIDTALGFVREHTPESSTRLVMILCCTTGCLCALGAVAFAFRHPSETGTTTALVGVVTALILNGCVAIALRLRKSGEPGDPPGDTP